MSSHCSSKQCTKCGKDLDRYEDRRHSRKCKPDPMWQLNKRLKKLEDYDSTEDLDDEEYMKYYMKNCIPVSDR